MTGVIQLFTHRGRTPRPEFRLRAEGGNFSTHARIGRPVGESRARGLLRRRHRLLHRQRSAQQPVPERDAVRHRRCGARTRRDAPLHRDAAERGKTGVPGQTAFGRPDLRRVLPPARQRVGDVRSISTSARCTTAPATGWRRRTRRRRTCSVDPPYTPAFEGRTAPFEFSDFTYRQPHQAAAPPRELPGRRHDRRPARAGTHVDTALIEWDGERATLRDALAGTSVPASRNNVGVTLQHQALWSAGVRHRGRQVRTQRQLRRRDGAAESRRVVRAQGDGAVGSTRLKASYGRGIKEPTILQSFSPNPFFLGNPGSAAGADACVRGRRRAAARRRPR